MDFSRRAHAPRVPFAAPSPRILFDPHPGPLPQGEENEGEGAMFFVQPVDRALRRAMLIRRGFAAIDWHRATERSIHHEDS